MKNTMLTTIMIAVVVGGLAFFGGMKYQQSQASTQQSLQVRQFGQRGRGAFERPTVGQIAAEDANSITLTLPDGSSKIVNIASSTKFTKTDTAALSDVKVGDRVAAMGPTNSDGSVTAQTVQINPLFRAGGTPSPTQ